jgi:hypothetical protein
MLVVVVTFRLRLPSNPAVLRRGYENGTSRCRGSFLRKCQKLVTAVCMHFAERSSCFLLLL